MKNTLIVISMVLVWAAHGGTIHAQPPAQQDPALICAYACLDELGPACQDEVRIVACLRRQSPCSQETLASLDEESRTLLLTRAAQHFTARTECVNPNVRQRRQRTRQSTTTTRTTTTRTTTTREERLAAARALARTAIPTDRQPTRAEIDQLQERVDQIPELRAEIEALRAELAAAQADSDYVDRLISERVERWARYLLTQDALTRCEPGVEWVSFMFDGREERIYCEAGQATEESAEASSAEDAGEVRVPRLRSRHQRNSRIGLLVDLSYWGSRYQLVAHAGSRSPKSVGFGLGVTVRLIQHRLYLIGAANAGVGIADGEHVPAQAHVHYRVGVLGIVAEHLMLGASAQFSHRYSGNGELREQNGTWYQLRHRGLRLDVGYIWRTDGWSPFFSVSGVAGVGCHADRRLANGEQCERDDLALMLTLGVAHVEH